MIESIDDQLLKWYSIWKETNALYSKIAKKSGLSDAAYWILYSVWLFKDECTQKKICEQWSYTKQTVNSALKELDGKGYIKLIPSKNDKRSKNIVLSEAGEMYAHTHVEIVFQIEKNIFKKMDENERVMLIQTSQKYMELLTNEIKDLYLKI